MKKAVTEAIREIERGFPDAVVTVKDDGEGGAYVYVEPVDISETYSEATRRTWIGFKIAFNYPFADLYPHHVRGDLARADGAALGLGMSASQFVPFEKASIQLSRRTPEGGWAHQTALVKVLKVIDWASKQ